MSRFSRFLTLSMVLCALPACNGDDPTPLPLVIAIEAGNGQTGIAGQPVGTPPTIKATRGSAPVAGTSVTFAVASGGGTIVGGTATTDAGGIARVTQWTLGPTLGQQTVTATTSGADGSPLTFVATAGAGAAATVSKEAGDAQSAVVGSAVANPPSVRVVDAGGNRVPGVTVTFTVGTGGGTVTNATATTNASGVATVGSWTLGTTSGANTLLANVQSGAVAGNPATFTATATGGAAATIAKQAGDAQTGTAGSATAIRPAVKVSDEFGNGVGGVSVTFAVASGGGTLTGSTVTTGNDGIATVGSWTLGNASGAQTLKATATGITAPVTFSVTSGAAAAKTVVINAGNAQTVSVGAPTPIKPSVKVTDQFGNAVPGVTVAFAVTTGNGSVSGGSPVTGADGIATVANWVVGTTIGANVLRATVTGAGITGNPVDFTATSVAGAPSQLTKVAGDLQTVLQGANVPVRPSVKLTDAFGNVLAGQQILFGQLGGGGVISGTSPTTNTSGIATLGGWTVGDAPGTNSVTASVGGLSVTFSVTALAQLKAGQYAGEYTGYWNNTTFNTTDAVSASIVNNSPSAGNAAITITAAGTILGVAGGIPATERVTAYTDTSAAFTGNIAQLGNIVMSVRSSTTDNTLNIVASGTNIPNPAITRWDASGTITPTQIKLNYTITYVSGSPSVGTIQMNKP